MRLLQVSLRSLLLYSIVLVAISIPVSLFAIREILNEEVDESLALHSDQFIRHIKTFEYLDDLELDLGIWDQLSYDVTIVPNAGGLGERIYKSISGYDSIEHESRPFRILESPVRIKGKDYLLTIRMSLVDNEELIVVLASIQVILLILLAGGLLLLNRTLSRRLWMPFYNTLNQLKAYELDKNESIQPETTNITEFLDLNKTVTHLTDRNRKVFLEQKEFIENASHELQTPLAIFQSKLDILMQYPKLDEPAAATIMELEETAQRMARLNKNLLLLSKIDNDQFTELERIDLSEVAERLLNNLKPLTELGEITLEISIEPAIFQANRTLIEVLFTNLFHNAIRHTTSNGVVSVELKGRRLSISNTGAALKMSPEKIFERFSKEGKSEKSTGLGLAIVKKICDSAGYKVDYSYHGNRHQFTIDF
ncbi:MAG TPA: HAMP domain-containing sensor histidine kinase [Chryseolinea sp.]|nr:HAMP domain-containing sensor histidine kinase [Chryseolinea sp.]